MWIASALTKWYSTHWGWGRMVAILQTALSNTFSCLKIWFKCQRNMLPLIQLTMVQPMIWGLKLFKHWLPLSRRSNAVILRDSVTIMFNFHWKLSDTKLCINLNRQSITHVISWCSLSICFEFKFAFVYILNVVWDFKCCKVVLYRRVLLAA